MTAKVILALMAAGALTSMAAAAEDPKPALDLSKIPPAATKAGVTYASDIKVIFDNSCVKCHGGEKPKARLRLDSLEGALKGGSGGKAIKPGDSTGSPLLHSVAQVGDPDYFMPPPGNKEKIPVLKKEEIALIRAWIDQGAK
jgi:mono/diheme cytochrome c family protein